MKIQFDLRPKDIKAANKNSRTYSEKLRLRLSYVQFIFWPLGIYLVQVIFLLTNSAPVSFALIYPVFYTFIGAFIIGPLLLEILFHVQYKRFISNPKNLNNKQIVFQKEGCEFTTKEETFFMKWIDLHQVIEDESYYFLYISDRRCFILPKAFMDVEKNELVKRTLDEHIKPYIQHHSQPSSNTLVKIGIIFIVSILGLFLFARWLDNSIYLLEQDAYDLFVGIENTAKLEEVLESNLLLKESVTLDEIQQVEEKVYSISSENKKQVELVKIEGLIYHANKLLIDRDKITRVYYSGEAAEYWQIENISVEYVSDYYMTISYGNLRAKSTETEKKVAYLKTEAHMVLNEKTDLLLKEEETIKTDAPMDFTEGKEMGIYGEVYQLDEGESPTKANGDPIGINDITHLYIVVQWKNKVTDELQEEKLEFVPSSKK